MCYSLSPRFLHFRLLGRDVWRFAGSRNPRLAVGEVSNHQLQSSWQCWRYQLAGRKAVANQDRTRVCYHIRKRVNNKGGGDASSVGVDNVPRTALMTPRRARC